MIQLLNLLYIISLAVCALAKSDMVVDSRIYRIKNLPVQEQLSTTMNGIYYNILKNTGFIPAVTAFEVWEDPRGNLILIPFEQGKADYSFESECLGVGYQLITASDNLITKWNVYDELLNVLEIREENIQTIGFPHLFQRIESYELDELFETWRDEGQQDHGSMKFNGDEFIFVSTDNEKKDIFIEEAAVYETKYQYVTILTTTTITETLNNNKPVKTYDRLTETVDYNSNDSGIHTSTKSKANYSLHSSNYSKGYSGLNPVPSSTSIKPTSTFYYDTSITSGLVSAMPVSSSRNMSGLLSFKGTGITTFSGKYDHATSSMTGLQSAKLTSMRNSLKGALASSSVTILTVSNSSMMQNNGHGDYRYEVLNSTCGILCLLISMIIFI